MMDHVIGGSQPAVVSVLWAAFGGCQHIRRRKEKWPLRARDSGRGQEEEREARANGAAPHQIKRARPLWVWMGGGRSCQVCVP
jgi:hypothetical protein